MRRLNITQFLLHLLLQRLLLRFVNLSFIRDHEAFSSDRFIEQEGLNVLDEKVNNLEDYSHYSTSLCYGLK
jgi:hypothetical protein